MDGTHDRHSGLSDKAGEIKSFHHNYRLAGLHRITIFVSAGYKDEWNR